MVSYLRTSANGGYERVEGTSFSAPLVAGLAACAQQAGGGKLPAMDLLRRMREASDLFPYYDYAHGYGRPEAGRLLARLKGAPPAVEPTFDFVVHDSLVAVVLRPAATVPAPVPLPLLAEADELTPATASWLTPPTPTRPPGSPTPTAANVPPVGQEQPAAFAPVLPPYPTYPARLYWHLANARGVLHRYEVRAVSQRLVVQVPRRLARGGDVLRVHYQGYTGNMRSSLLLAVRFYLIKEVLKLIKNQKW
ncbi:MAG: S8 family serine peptidase [Hymenobacter sp.]